MRSNVFCEEVRGQATAVNGLNSAQPSRQAQSKSAVVAELKWSAVQSRRKSKKIIELAMLAVEKQSHRIGLLIERG